jgi:putative membrane protein
VNTLLSFASNNLIVVILGGIGIGLLLDFIARYFVRAVRLTGLLGGLIDAVTEMKRADPETVREELTAIFADDRTRAAWKEFEETLHEQYEIRAGERKPTAVRATVLAESFFNVGNLVDPWIGSEYFKHLPGILTGLGIIGTFWGLIQGLIQFDPTVTDTLAVKLSLRGLFVHVEEAFKFSGCAITAAIFVTLLEKLLYAACAKRVGELSLKLDGLFRTGVGEEYLSSLVVASETSATQVRQLKDAMVEDLKVLLTNLTDRQIAATQQLSTDLGAQIQESLRAPLAQIADTVRQVSGQQGEQMGAVLEQLMTSFLAQMREAMGNQVGNLSGLMQQTSQSVAQVESALRSLVADLQRAGQASNQGVQTAVEQLLQKLAAHQERQSSAVSEATSQVFAQLQEALSRIASAQEAAAQRAKVSQDELSTALQARVAYLSDAHVASVQATRETLDQIGGASSAAIAGLNQGAQSIATAVSGIRAAAEQLGRTASELSALEGRSVQASQSIAQTTAVLSTVAQEISRTASQLGGASLRLEAVSRLTAAEEEARSALLKDLQEVFVRSREAGAQFAALTEEIRTALESGFNEFGTGVSKVTSTHLFEYQKQLGDAVGMLKNALEEMAEYADSSRG